MDIKTIQAKIKAFYKQSKSLESAVLNAFTSQLYTEGYIKYHKVTIIKQKANLYKVEYSGRYALFYVEHHSLYAAVMDVLDYLAKIFSCEREL